MLVLVAAALACAAPASVQASAPAATTGGTAIPALYENCTALNHKYPHGLGRLNAKDKTSGVPATTFKRSTRLYNLADSYNGGLDRDNDKIACEKK
jgi:hypothetical protein